MIILSSIKNYNKLKNIGNYTKGAVKNFENAIVSEKNYLEKVDKNLQSKKGEE